MASKGIRSFSLRTDSDLADWLVADLVHIILWLLTLSMGLFGC